VKGLGKKGLGKSTGAVAEKKIMPVETNPEKLVNFCCGLNYKTSGEEVKIKPDSEYPEWLWKLHVGKPKTLEELDPNTKAYWRKLRSLGLRRNIVMMKLKKF
jgi:large subunit ribosomal protein L54